jgi:hypothetical protein
MSAGIMVTQAPKSTSHLFHLIMTLLTFGLWFPIWMIMWIINANSRRRVVTGTQTTHYSPPPGAGPPAYPRDQFRPPPG